ncbi:hypothetical protein PG988_013791 [Apiospora saccharicola]
MVVIHADAEPRAALEAGRTIRCLTRRRYRPESRRSAHAKAWAQKHAGKLCRGLVRDLGRDPAPVFTMQLLMVQLRRRHAYFCFDVYLPPSTESKKDEVFNDNEACYAASVTAGASVVGDAQPPSEECQQRDHFKTDQPVYHVYKDGEAYGLRRNKNLDKIFALHYSEIQQCDKGGLPYFVDTFKPSFYIDGILQEDTEPPKGTGGDDGEERVEEEKEDVDSGDKDAEEMPAAAEPSPDSADLM